MKHLIKILFAILKLGFLCAASKNDVTVPPVDDRVGIAQSLLIKEAFMYVKPKSEGLEHAYEAVQKTVKEENAHKVLISAKQLFPDRVAYLKALAAQANTEKYTAFGALLYDVSQKKQTFAREDALTGFVLGMASTFFIGVILHAYFAKPSKTGS